jgi:uncharacterized membrane protein YkoI
MAIYANLNADQGSDFFSQITVEGSDGNIFDLTGYTSRGQVRKTYASSTAYDLHAAINNPTNGLISISLSSTQTAAMRPGRYVYDVEIVDAQNVVTRVVEGQVEISPRVTRVS